MISISTAPGVEGGNDGILPKVGIALSTEPAFVQATLPLFQNADIDVIEWSFDTLTDAAHTPLWLDQMLEEYGAADRLLGHEVFFSLLDGRWSPEHDQWITALKKEGNTHRYQQLTAHFGYMTHGDFHRGCPLPVPLTTNVLNLGIDRLMRIQEVAKVPVGVENLALAFTEDDVQRQGAFLAKMVAPVNGFLILDLHNCYCQAHNFNIDIMQLIGSYPLDLVREIHVSGGSWDHIGPDNKRIRRDTHDGGVPEVIFEVLPEVLKKCPYLEYVLLEQLGSAFKEKKDQLHFQKDFYRLKQVVGNASKDHQKKAWGNTVVPPKTPWNDEVLYRQQRNLETVLSKARKVEDVREGFTDWQTEAWKTEMIATAIKVYQKWN
ncbi:multinuclear nonheme iron-dependent oxidase [Maribacter sp. 2-571]|uniref:multinuclear nonheme iron-dependent oxidase n=1 Tax=Maribacter sp. 2-571 TaxID=3417569 RepID=UPI003D353213